MQLLFVLAGWTVLGFCRWMFLCLWAIRYLRTGGYLGAVGYLGTLLFAVEFGQVKFLLLNKLDITFAIDPTILTTIPLTLALQHLSQTESRASSQVSLDFHPRIILSPIQNPLLFGRLPLLLS